MVMTIKCVWKKKELWNTPSSKIARYELPKRGFLGGLVADDRQQQSRKRGSRFTNCWRGGAIITYRERIKSGGAGREYNPRDEGTVNYLTGLSWCASRAGGQFQVARRAPNTRFDPFLFEVGYYLVFLEATRPKLLYVSNPPISFKLNKMYERPLYKSRSKNI